jgi:single-strand DNA-binding protein
MPNLNKVMLIGHLGQDPELRYTSASKPVCSFSLATSEKYKDKSGVAQSKTEWHNIVVWDKLAELASQYLKKGSAVYIEGKLTYRQWDADGVKKYRTEIIGLSMQFLSGGKKADAEATVPATGDAQGVPVDDNDLPF